MQKRGLERYSEMIWRPFFEKEFREIVGKKVVDMGCGDGRYTGMLSNYNEYYGVDIDDKAVMATFIGRVEEIPLPDNHVDEVIAIGILDYSDQVSTIKEANRVLKVGGKFRVMVPNTMCPYHMLAAIFNFRYHKKTYVWGEFVNLIKSGGFDIEYDWEDGFCFWVPTKWLQDKLIPFYLAFNTFLGGIMGNNMYIRAVKQ